MVNSVSIVIYFICIFVLVQDKLTTQRELPAKAISTIKEPNRIIADQIGNLYIIEDGHILRYEVKTKIIYPFPIKNNISELMRRPMALSACQQGHLIVSDIYNSIFEFGSPLAENNRVIITDAAQGVMRHFRRVQGILCDDSENVYIMDDMGHRIFRYDALADKLTVFAGTGENGFCGDGGLAINSCFSFPMQAVRNEQGDMYIADAGNNRIRKIDANSNIINTVVGNGESESTGDGKLAIRAGIHQPDDIAIDKQGNLFILESGRSTVRRVDAKTGIITRYAGTDERGYSGDGGLAIHARLNNPSSITIDEKGDLYIADWSNNCIRKIDATTGVISTIRASRRILQ